MLLTQSIIPSYLKFIGLHCAMYCNLDFVLKIKGKVTKHPGSLTLIIPRFICNSLFCLSNNSYNVSMENLVLDQLIIP